MPLSQLDFGEALAIGAVNAFCAAMFIGLAAGLVVKRYELEHQTRTSLRTTYTNLLVAQRRSRQLSVMLAQTGGQATNPDLAKQAIAAHDEFIDSYHALNLDVSKQMWRDVCRLRNILDDMLELALEGEARGCADLVDVARAARQNLERSFRARLRHSVLQRRKPLGGYDAPRREAPPGASPPTRLRFRLLRLRSWRSADR
ncbi:hypothetical protein GCM10010449_44030 [Streptomyces rectiviolaceus]|uniref:Uncharacterized protein n=1 Tax=Streptomyces rectiviolaceus TaxID=332591 RepID=A0ABP6MLY4_9ACTN